MSTKGAEKQEKKITELAEIANKDFPDIGVMSFKGAFRFGAKSAVEKSQFNNWEEVVNQPPNIRRNFFKSLLEESRPHLKRLIGEESLQPLLDKLIKEIGKFEEENKS